MWETRTRTELNKQHVEYYSTWRPGVHKPGYSRLFLGHSQCEHNCVVNPPWPVLNPVLSVGYYDTCIYMYLWENDRFFQPTLVCSSGSSGQVQEGARNIKSMQLPSAVIVFYDLFLQDPGGRPPRPPSWIRYWTLHWDGVWKIENIRGFLPPASEVVRKYCFQ